MKPSATKRYCYKLAHKDDGKWQGTYKICGCKIEFVPNLRKQGPEKGERPRERERGGAESVTGGCEQQENSPAVLKGLKLRLLH